MNEFAYNLRQGSVDLPLNDRSTELLKENKKLKEDFQIYQIKLGERVTCIYMYTYTFKIFLFCSSSYEYSIIMFML